MALAAGLVFLGSAAGSGEARLASPQDAGAARQRPQTEVGSFAELNMVVGRFCVRCHNNDMLTGGLTLESFDVAQAGQNAEVAEKMIRKLQAGMMPARPAQRPDPDTVAALVAALEERVDLAAADHPRHGGRTFQRLNRAEYARSVRELLAIDVDAGLYLPPDPMSAGFDNIADVQGLSATVMEGYLSAASEISRLAIGDPEASPAETILSVPRYASQTEQVEGAPFGTRGGISVDHVFPADGEYVFTMAFFDAPIANLYGKTTYHDEQIEVSIDGERVALLDLDRWMDADNESLETEPIWVNAGLRRFTAAFLRKFEGPVPDLLSPHEWSLADKTIGAAYGVTTLPHLRNMSIKGPYNSTGVSSAPSRAKIFVCRPTAAEEERPCAERILARLGAEAYRRPLTTDDLAGLMSFYETGSAQDGFEAGIRTALEAILASPHFVFRFERSADGGAPDGDRWIDDPTLASRLSFFLWAAPPDEKLMALAREGRLSEPPVLERQVTRMLADPRSEALATRFAAQWLRLQDLEKIHPDSLMFPDFHDQLASSMRRETELLFNSVVQEDRSVLDLLTANYTFVDERLARHYGIPGVTGDRFRRVELPGEERRGLLGQGSILTLTSHADRTSPVLRGKWVMVVMLGSPPPPPPPDVPELEATEAVQEGRQLTVRERLEQHRSNPFCRSCHQVIDPIGLALENFDVTGAWRAKDSGAPVDTSGELYDGTELNGPADLRRALLKYSDAFITTFAENLMAYGLGRRVEYTDMPEIRAIVSEAADNDYRMSSFILGVAKSAAFRSNDRALETEAGAEDEVIPRFSDSGH